jgi:hypothetical protein
MKRYELARIVFPTPEWQDYTELFVRERGSGLQINGKYAAVKRYKFDTWMNLFAAEKYYHYCDLGKLYLNLRG